MGNKTTLLAIAISAANIASSCAAASKREEVSVRYDDGRSIRIYCELDLSCKIDVHIMGRNFTFDGSDIMKESIVPTNVILYPDIKPDHEFVFRIQYSCDSPLPGSCYAEIVIRNGKVAEVNRMLVKQTESSVPREASE